MIDWNAPLKDAFTNMPVFVAGIQRSLTCGNVYIVTDYRGRRQAFFESGNSVTGSKRVVNVDPTLMVRQVLVSMIAQRSEQLVLEDKELQALSMESSDMWGCF